MKELNFRAALRLVNQNAASWLTEQLSDRQSAAERFARNASRLKALVAPALPSFCLLCEGRAQTGRGLCQGCREELPRSGSGCRRCALPLPRQSGGALCQGCRQSPPVFRRCHALFHYASPVRELIAAYKYRHSMPAGRVLAELLQDESVLASSVPGGKNAEPHCWLVPVPLHISRLRERGFNQAAELARALGKRWGLPLDLHSCRRSRATSAQQGLGARARQHNLSRAFELNPDCRPPWPRGARLIIVDDVVTTGATVSALSETLSAAGAGPIDICCLARA